MPYLGVATVGGFNNVAFPRDLPSRPGFVTDIIIVVDLLKKLYSVLCCDAACVTDAGSNSEGQLHGAAGTDVTNSSICLAHIFDVIILTGCCF
jgi:hypothetical protein